MRDHIIAQLESLDLGQFRVSSELPWSAAGTPLYIKNPRVFYVDEPDHTQGTQIQTLNGPATTIADRDTVIAVYVVCDAKQKPSNYDDLMASVESIAGTLPGVRNREVDRITTFEADQILTEFEFRFRKLAFN